MRKILFLLLLCLTTSASAQFFMPNQKPMLGLQANWGHPLVPTAGWLFNEGSGGQVYDLSGNGNTGILQGTAPSWSAGKFGSAVLLPGTDEGIQIPSCFATDPTEVTFAAWCKVDDTAAEYRLLGYNEEGFYLSIRINQGGTANRIYTFMYDGAADAIQTDAYSVTEWLHIAVTSKEGGNTKLYVNGTFIGQDTATGSYTLATNLGRHIGCDRWRSSGWLKGLIDHAVMYNRVLTTGEIIQLYSKPFCFMQPSWDWVLYGGISVGTKTGQVIFINEM